MAVIYHITSKENWSHAKERQTYDYCALKTDGFIHCSTFEQTIPTANRFYKGQTELVVLEIDEDKIKAKILYELGDDVNEKFPHIYGEINIDAVTAVKEFERDSDDYFTGLKDQVYL